MRASAICVNDSLLFHPGADKSLVVWDMDRQKELGRLVGHDKQILAVAARGDLEVSAQYSGPTRLWNLEAMQCTATLPDMLLPGGHGTFSACCAASRVLLGSAAGPVKLWDIATSAPVALPDLEGHTGVAYSVKASANTVLSGSSDKTVRLWDLRTGKCVRIMGGHTDGVISVDMDRHCRTAVSGSKDTMVRLWDLGSGRCSDKAFEGHLGGVRDVVMHKSGSSFLSSGRFDFTVNGRVVGSGKASMRADLKALCPAGRDWASRMFASRDLSTVAHCCFNSGERKLELRLWK